MKKNDPLEDILDRPIAYNPAFKRICSSTVGALMLSQAWYWSKRTSNDDGWFYKTVEEWTEETGLTRYEQETARKHLQEFLTVEYRGMPAQNYYRVNKDEIYGALGLQIGVLPPSRTGESPDQDRDIPPTINMNSESTTENTTDVSKIVKSANKTVDFILRSLSPKAIQDAIRDFFKLTPNWDVKYNRQWMEWAIGEGVTPEQIDRASLVWKMDKRFNWSVPTLKGIQEHWLSLIEEPEKPETTAPDTDGGYRI